MKPFARKLSFTSKPLQKISFRIFPMNRLILLCAVVWVCGASAGLAQTPPILHVDLSPGSQARLSWTNTSVNFFLEETATLSPVSVWWPFPQNPTLLFGQFSVLVDITDRTRFFRLHALQTGLPPNPASIAPPVPEGIATQLGSATEFLYSGSNPIQSGVAPGTIEAKRAAVVRGKVKNRDNNPLSGAAVSILNHPEFGQTLSRVDGMFDLAVNGGGLLTVNYQKSGLLVAQRQVNVPWQDYVTMPDVTLIPLDSEVTTIDLTTATPIQTARGSRITDSDGSRQATLLFPQGTQAQLVMPDGSALPITTLNVRATEYTVGPRGPNAMPGELPPSSAYTYAVELSADEAIAAGAQEVRFSSPVPFYVENFIGFPVGSLVPTGFYDRGKGLWMASDNGRVIKVMSITDGLAELDLEGRGTIANATALASFGIKDEERRRLASLYTSGQELWRVPIPHCTPWDHNWPYGPPPGSSGPGGGGGGGGGGPKPDKRPKGGPNKDCGSIIGTEPQTLGEVINLTGTPFSLHYESDRMPGRRDAHILNLQLSGTNLPPGLQRIHLEVSIAGQRHEKSFEPKAQLFDKFTWNGKDAYGRTIQGKQPVKIRIGYEYIASYFATEDSLAASYNRFGSPPIAVASGAGGGPVVFSRLPVRTTTPSIILWQDYEESLGGPVKLGFGGWSLSLHHTYEPLTEELYLGDGSRRIAKEIGVVISTIAGDGSRVFNGDGGQADQSALAVPNAIATAPDGSLYIADTYNSRIRRVGTDGIITTVAGNGTDGFSGDGGLATQAALARPLGVATAPDGSLYIADTYNSRIRRVGTDGIITTVAGNGAFAFMGDGGPALQAAFGGPQAVLVARDGSLYIADPGSYRIRRVAPDGIITTVAGNGLPFFNGDGIPATQASMAPFGIALSLDGSSLYIADGANHRIRRVGLDGIVTTVAGAGFGAFFGDGGQAVQAGLNQPYGVTIGIEGSLYIADRNNLRIRRVAPDGIISTVAGNGMSGFSGDGGLARQSTFKDVAAVAAGLDGRLYIADGQNSRIRQLGPPLPGFSVSDTLIAAEDGSEVYIFNSAGRHLSTLNTLTGAVRFQFTYDNVGRLAAVTDVNNNMTTIERDSGGNPSAIVSPFGQRTILAINTNGYLSGVTNPAGEAVQLTYNSGDADGLLATLADTQGNMHRYTYDTLGRLVRDENPAGGVKILTRNDIKEGHYIITVTTALGLASTYEVEELSTGDTRRVRIEPGGARTETILRTDGSRRVSYPDGTVVELVDGPDPRFGMQAPIQKSLIITTPQGITMSRSASRALTLSDPNNLLSLSSKTDTVTLNGLIYTSTYTAATHQVTTTTPQGRHSVSTFDALGRVLEEQSDTSFGLAPVRYTYDNRGRLAQLAHGIQSWTYDYDSQSRLTRRTDAAGSSMSFAYDALDRRSQVTLPSGRKYGFNYNPESPCCDDDSPTQITMPNLEVHKLGYTPINQESGYTPPGNNPYVTSYDAEGRISLVTLPSGRTETFSYDGGSRITGFSYPEATVVFAYATGDSTARLNRLTRTPATGGPSQEIVSTYDSELLTAAMWSGAAQGQYNYTYDNNFLLKSLSLTSGADAVTTVLARDNDGLLTGLGPFTFLRSGPSGNPVQITDGTFTLNLGYDLLGRIINRTHTVGGQQKYAIQFTYDAVGRISRRVEATVGTTKTNDYFYDADSQLIEARRDGSVEERYTYDSNRNRLSREVVGNPVETAIYDSQDRLVQHGAVTYKFNADGYQTQRGNDTFQYSTTGELLQTIVDGQTVTYAYDGLRRRVSRTDAAGTIQYLYGNPDNNLQVSNTRDLGGVLTTYYYDDGSRLFALQRGSARYYVATDQLGTPRVITDSAGALMKVVEYDSFGTMTLDSNPSFAMPIGFAGGLVDRTTGLVRFGFRDYDPIAGRWTARDPAVFNSDQINLYAYTHNNPVNLIDIVGFGSAGVSVYDGIGAGFKLSWTDGGISACFEAGFGNSASVEVDPSGGLDENGVSLEAKAGFKFGIGKIEAGVDIGECAKVKGKVEACVGPLCSKAGDGSFKDKLSLDEKGSFKNPYKGVGLGLTAKIAGKICQQAKW